MSRWRDRKRAEEPQEEGAPGWMNTYGDMVTLLLTFFVMLFSFSVIDAKKWEEIASAFSGTPFVSTQSLDAGVGSEISIPGLEGRPTETEKTDEPDEGTEEEKILHEKLQEDFTQLYEEMKGYIKEKRLDALLSIQKQDGIILLRMKDSALFDSGKADIKDESLSLLDYTSEIFSKYSDAIKMVRIEGHTDTVPMTSPQFKDNWDLSTMRATNVLRFLLESSALNPKQYSAVGYGEFQPVESNDSEEGKAANRRVDFVILGFEND